jgi:pilus assembly protein Flp/PilA
MAVSRLANFLRNNQMLSIARNSIRNVLADRKGVTALEYAVVAGGVIVAVIAAVGLLETSLNGAFTNFLGKLIQS